MYVHKTNEFIWSRIIVELTLPCTCMYCISFNHLIKICRASNDSFPEVGSIKPDPFPRRNAFPPV